MSLGLKARLFLARRRWQRAANWRDYHRDNAAMHQHRAEIYHGQACDAQDEISMLKAKLRSRRLGAPA